MKRFILFVLLSLFSLGGFAMTDVEWQEVSVADGIDGTEMVSIYLPRQNEKQELRELKKAMNSAKVSEIAYISIGSACLLAGTSSVLFGINKIRKDKCTEGFSNAKEYHFLYFVASGATVGLTSIPLYMMAHQKHKKYKRLKLQLKPMMSRDVMGTVSVSPGVGVSLNF